MTDISREIIALEAIAKLPVVQANELVFVVRDKKGASQAIKALKKADRSGRLLNRITIKTVADFVKA
jgi:hypothetical protein